jgi:hypothetical protein
MGVAMSQVEPYQHYLDEYSSIVHYASKIMPNFFATNSNAKNLGETWSKIHYLRECCNFRRCWWLFDVREDFSTGLIAITHKAKRWFADLPNLPQHHVSTSLYVA